MSLNRRELLRLGAVGAGGAMVSAVASSTPLGTPGAFVFRTPAAPIDPLAPVAAAPRTPLNIDPALFERAKAALNSHAIAKRDVIGIVDFSQGSHLPRFSVVDMASGFAEHFRVAHGRGSDPAHSGFVERFSNQFGSEASSNGTYVTAATYHGKYGLSMKVRGLDWTNNNAEGRAIVIHNAWYAEPDMIAIHGKLGRSEGCFAFSQADQWKVMNRLGGGRMIYADKLA